MTKFESLFQAGTADSHLWARSWLCLLSGIGIALSGLPVSSHAAIDEARLPPPANVTVDFGRDIRPIFENACWRCHGPERPKSHFRLDNRESALKGGDNGIDIIPGSSEKSPLVHYVARLVPDMEMPPAGKGDPLTLKQVGLLRAWIDQGAGWGATNPPAQSAFSAAPTLRWIGVQGNKAKFREVEGLKEGFGGGIENFSIHEQIGPDKSFSAEGRALFPDDDFQIKLLLQKSDVGFVRAGFEQWRRYYDDTGGFYQPFGVSSFDLGRDLHLDIGRAWIDFGLTLPDWPQVIAGYEYQFKDGTKSTLEWGAVNLKNIYPASENIHEQVHILKFDVAHEFHAWRLEDSARVEFYDNRTRHDDVLSYTPGATIPALVQTSYGATHVQGMNAIRVERQLKEWWLVTGGYIYSGLDADASIDQISAGATDTTSTFWSGNQISLKRDTHAFSLGSLLRPADWLSASAGVQGEWTHEEGFGRVNLDSGDPYVPGTFSLYPATLQSDLDQQRASESLSLRFTAIPYTVLFAEGRFDQECIGQAEQDMPDAGFKPDPEKGDFLRDTDYSNEQRNWRAGFNTSPWRWVALEAHYRNRFSSSDYDHQVDLFRGPESGILEANPGYSAFIRQRKIQSDEVHAKLVLRLANWLRTTLTYQWLTTDYSVTTDPVPNGTRPEGLAAGNHDSHVFGLGLNVAPFQRLSCSGNLTYSDSRTTTAPIGSSAIVPYEGNLYTAVASATYALNPATDLRCAYSFSRSDYGQNNFDGVPLGLTYTRHALMAGISRRLTSYLTSTFRYSFYRYSEPSSGGLNDYTAHGIFGTLV